jgi:hypothetical protein
MSKPTIQVISAHCAACDRDIQIELLVNVPITVAAEWMRLRRCPECGADSEQLSI